MARSSSKGPRRQVFEEPKVQRTRDFLSHLGWHGESLAASDLLVDSSAKDK